MTAAERSPLAVVFLHGWLMDTGMWQQQVTALAAQGVRAYAVRQPGHGSPGATAGFTMTAWAERLHDELAAERITRPLLVGHSMGGMLALEYYRRYGEQVIGLGLISTTDTAWEAERRELFAASSAAVASSWGPAVASAVGNVLIGPSFFAAHPSWLAEWERTVAGYDLASFVNLGRAIAERDDMTAVSAAIGVPVLVIHGPEDNAVPFAEGQAMAGRCRTAELVAVPGCGHAPSLEQPAAVNAALVPFAVTVVAGG